MPTYDYVCDKCGNTFEEQLSIANRKVPEGNCVECNNGDIRQVIGTPLFAYDNISSPGHLKKPPRWMKDKLQEVKRTQPGAIMNIPD